MTEKVVTPIAEIIRETAAAFLVQANSQVWLPKSQVSVISTNFGLAVELPMWLLNKNKGAFDKNGYAFYTESNLFWRKVDEGEVSLI